MRKICFVNGSPRFKNSTSEYLCNIVKKQFTEPHETCDIHIASLTTEEKLHASFETLMKVDTILIAFPLYIDSLPAHLVAFLQKWEAYIKQEKQRGIIYSPKLFILANNGFIEGTQNHIALDMLRHFNDRVGFSWGLAIGIGGGEFMKGSDAMPLECKVKIESYNALCLIAKELSSPTLTNSSPIMTSPTIPKTVFQYAASFGWIPAAKQNGTRIRDLYNTSLLEKK